MPTVALSPEPPPGRPTRVRVKAPAATATSVSKVTVRVVTRDPSGAPPLTTTPVT